MKAMVSTFIFIAACTTSAGDGLATQACRPEGAAKLVGHSAPDDAGVRLQTGAELIRRIAPGDAVTHDFRENRITLAVDPAGRVVQAICG